jgi:DNA-binding LytR/AlgR family response regulator
LLKPIDPKDLETALLKFENQRFKQNPLDIDALSRLIKKETYKDRFLVKTGQQLTFLPTIDVAYFRSSDGLTQAFNVAGKKFFVEHTLEELEDLLDPREFFRISRGLTVRLSAIQKIHPHLNGRLKLELAPASSEDVFVSRERAGAFKVWLGG